MRHDYVKKQTLRASRYMGLVAVIIQVSIIAFVATRTGFNWFGRNPISNLGTTYLFLAYSVAFVLAGAALLAFLVYLHRNYHPSKWFERVLILGILGEILTGVVPDKANNKRVPLDTLTSLHIYL